ncbi:hypothetical protein OV203_47115 [Nannocystis sp. ILAH1]|uniref:hypothetical protein n=1 Tax=Nannocystis sp. ILAH1 TaxID=2996789 RepID=UPI00226DA010|nr:hypothetical protein [Nannocystis sp. ILAH1]MCY0994788.1 hypothetical protein [Nannocystis sp. ILAH1]
MTTHADPPGLLEMETLPPTTNYRAERQKLWELLRQKRDEYVARAQQYGATPAAAAEAAGRSFRGEVNLFLGEVLTHSRKDDVLAFLMDAPREWGARSEVLLDADPLIPSLVARSFPVGAWVDRYEEISKRVADDNKQWSIWLAARLEQVGQTGAAVADRVFGVVETVGQGVGEGVGGLGKGLGGLFGSVGEGLGKAVMIGVGVVSVGAVVVGGIYLLRDKS